MKIKVPACKELYAADKTKKDAEKAVRKKSPLSNEMKALPAESSKSKEEEDDENSTEEYFASISPEYADKMALGFFNAMPEEEKDEQLSFFLDAQEPE